MKRLRHTHARTRHARAKPFPMPSYHAIPCRVMSCRASASQVVNSTPAAKLTTQEPYPDRRPGCQQSPSGACLAFPCSLLYSTLNSYSHPEFLGRLKRRTHVRFSRLSPACIQHALPPPRRAVSADSEWKEQACRGVGSGRYM